jgi:hypothetical protein
MSRFWRILPACLAISLAVTPLADAQEPARPGWWMTEPIRLVQTNLRETDDTLDPKKLAQQLADFPANVILFGMGGIAAHYPSKVPSHYVSPHIPPGRDTFGEMLKEAHSRKIRVIGRFDFSKVAKPIYDAHPNWFFKKADGQGAFYNGLYATCINGAYYREEVPKILTEALEQYDVDGLFFNMPGQPASDYSGNQYGICNCDSCKRRFDQMFHRPLPTSRDADYNRFISTAVEEVTRDIGSVIHTKRPKAGYFTYTEDYVDGTTSESNTAVTRSLPLWPFSASESVLRARTTQPSKMPINLSIGFVDIPYRFASVPPAEIQIRLYENMAHGSGPAFVVVGTLDQEDRTGILAAKPAFKFHADHEDLYVGQESAARVLLLSGGRGGGGGGRGGRGGGGGGGPDSYRGFFRILTEQHIPFALSSDPGIVKSRKFDLVIAPDGAPPELEEYVQQGGRLLMAGARESGISMGRTVKRWTDTRSAYFRIHDRNLFPSLKDRDLVPLVGDYLEIEAPGKPPLTLIPPSMFGPPEKVHIDRVETEKPGLVLADRGKGRIAYVPWDVGGVYYRLSLPGHADLIGDLVDHLLPGGRQLKSNAHPLVEMTLMNQPARSRSLVHLVNLSGHFATGYFPPVPMRDIEVQVQGKFRKARSARLNRELPLSTAGGYVKVTLPQLEAYDAVIFDQ